jgi:hypothetical protein
VIEGQEVTWTGPQIEGHLPGDRGQLLSFAGRNVAHILWSTGVFTGDVEIVDIVDLQAGRVAVRGLVDDSLEIPLSVFAVREVFDAEGEAGVLNAMASMGHLGTLAGIANEALGIVEARIRHDPSFLEVLAHLDDHEAEALVNLAATCLIRDAFEVEA